MPTPHVGGNPSPRSQTDLSPFRFGDIPVRIEDRNGAPWFALSDICRVLDIANVGDAASRLDDDEKDDVALTDAIGREQTGTVINESGFYRLVLRSRKPAARRFSRWVTADVLPTIRRTGAYGMPPPPDLNDNATLRTLLLGKLEQVDAVQAENDQLREKATALDRLANTAGAMCVTDTAKALGIPPKRLFGWLIGHSWIYKRGRADNWLAYQNRLDAGVLKHKITRLTRTDGTTKITEQVLVTAKGLARLASEVPGATLSAEPT